MVKKISINIALYMKGREIWCNDFSCFQRWIFFNGVVWVNELGIIWRLNCSFSPITFSELQFWPPKEKKTTKQPPKFCNCSSFGPQCWYWLGLRWRGTLSDVPRVIIYFFLPWEPKLLQLQNLGGCFVVFFLRGLKSQLWKS